MCSWAWVGVQILQFLAVAVMGLCFPCQGGIPRASALSSDFFIMNTASVVDYKALESCNYIFLKKGRKIFPSATSTLLLGDGCQ